MKNKIKIAVFGGTFDPFTISHKQIIEKLRNDYLADIVIVSPTIVNWHRDKNDIWFTDAERLEFCKKVIYKINCANNAKNVFPDFKIILNSNDIYKKQLITNPNLLKDFISYWGYIDTLKDLQKQYSVKYENIQWFTVIGSDSLKMFKQWKNWQEILKLSKLIVFNNRNNERVKSDINFIDLEIPSEFINVSASNVRKIFRKKLSENIDKEKIIKDYLIQFSPNHNNDNVLIKTPIFDLVERQDNFNIGFKPVCVKSNNWVSIAVEFKDHFLVVKQLRYGLMKTYEEFPCGIVENHESPSDAVIRELKEETGIEIHAAYDHLEYLGRAAANPAFMTNYMYYFYLNLNNTSFKKENTNFDKHEKIISYWKDKNYFIKKYLTDDLNIQQFKNDDSVFLQNMMFKLKLFKKI